MIIVDFCGWTEWFTDITLADRYKKYLEDPENILLPAIILYKVYKIKRREVGKEKALLAAGYMKTATMIPFDDTLALIAADIALRERLAMPDAIIVAVSRIHHCTIISSDADLKNQANVVYLPRE